MVIAFCTAVMNRLWQVQQTLPWNLARLEGTPHTIALCDYDSRDGLDRYVRDTFGRQVRSGALSYFRTEEPTGFHASKAKNAAHRLGLRRRPDVLFNLDADNFITEETLAAVDRVAGEGGRFVLHQWSRGWSDGTFGRIALPAAEWEALGGYDEALLEMSWQDIDLLGRARAVGLRYCLQSAGVRPAIQNTLRQKLANVATDSVASEQQAQGRLRDLHIENMVRSFGRPVRIPSDQQHRYQGVLDFEEDALV